MANSFATLEGHREIIVNLCNAQENHRGRDIISCIQMYNGIGGSCIQVGVQNSMGREPMFD